MLKKSLLFTTLSFLLGGLVIAQAPQRSCSTMDVDARLRAEDPFYAANREAIEQFTQNYIATEANSGERAVVTIPVVVHIVYNIASENISDAQVYNQLDVLNDDFRRLNSDVGETPGYFAGVAADCEINFCLATLDPSGNPTTGITRTSTSKTSFSTGDDMKFGTYGHTIWDRNKYLNLWVCDLSGGLLGYAQFPGGSASTDGVVIDYVYFGVGGAGSAPYDLGRTATHEVGHWLNLYHIWGDDGTGCAGSDLCADTPNQADETYGCPNGAIRISCSNGPNGDMYQNYMDYTDDGCMNLFTAGQKTRAQALFAVGGSRASLLTSNGCGGGGGGTCNAPTGMNTTLVATTSATFNWTAAAGATSYNVRYKTTAGATWTNTTSATTSKAVTGLTAATAYEWQVQTVCAAGTSAFTSSTTFTTTGGGGACVDNYEPNNTSGTAATLSAGTTYLELIASSTDVDWFKFTTTGSNTKIKISLSSLPADYDVRLYNQSVAQKGISENGGTTSETIIWNTTQAGTRYVKVYGWDGAFSTGDCYDLLISTSSSNWRTDGSYVEMDEYDNSIVSVFPNPASGDIVTVDYYSVQEDMNVGVQVYDILGKQVVNTSNSVVAGENMIEMNVSKLEAGFYFVVISNGKSSYSEKFVIE